MNAVRYVLRATLMGSVGFASLARADQLLNSRCQVLISLQSLQSDLPSAKRLTTQIRALLDRVPRALYEIHIEEPEGRAQLDRVLSESEVKHLTEYFMNPLHPDPLMSDAIDLGDDVLDSLYSTSFFNAAAHQLAIIQVLAEQDRRTGSHFATQALDQSMVVHAAAWAANPMQLVELIAATGSSAAAMEFVLQHMNDRGVLVQTLRDEPDHWQPYFCHQQYTALGAYLETIFSDASPATLSVPAQAKFHDFLRMHIYWALDNVTSGDTSFFLNASAVNLVNYGRLAFAHSLTSVGIQYWEAAGKTGSNNPYRDLHDLLAVNLQAIEESQKLSKQGFSEDDYLAAERAASRYHFLRSIPDRLEDTMDDFSLSFGQEFDALPGWWEPVRRP